MGDMGRQGLTGVGARALLAVFNLWLLVRYNRMARYFHRLHGRLPNLSAPVYYTEKVHWRKIFDDDPRFAVLLDKLKSKAFVSGRVPWLTYPPVLWEGADATRIPFDELTVPYIVKCNHGSGMNVVVADPKLVDRADVVARMSKHLGRRHGTNLGERAYWHIEPRVFAEQLIGADEGYMPTDYKFCVAGGRVVYVMAITGRATVLRRGFYDRDWQRLAITESADDASLDIPRPESFSRMVEAVEALGADFDLLRIDLYEEKGEPVFGEFTIYPRSGLFRFDPSSFDLAVSERWDLARSAYLRDPPSRFARCYKAVLAAAGHIRA
ncbi:MAG: hypothetical protein J0H31_20025 [Alphaproteobacteria bacterium]|nr:hypothetical protein [Alphaproteobacteria bacterium]